MKNNDVFMHRPEWPKGWGCYHVDGDILDEDGNLISEKDDMEVALKMAETDPDFIVNHSIDGYLKDPLCVDDNETWEHYWNWKRRLKFFLVTLLEKFYWKFGWIFDPKMHRLRAFYWKRFVRKLSYFFKNGHN